ncbi:carbohydrate ABC transporter permease [bacterium]|nr:MAG: carbohydrate ABC transporter permease [bacterium]
MAGGATERPGASLWISRFGLALGLVFFLFPIYWMLVTSVKPPSEWLTNPPLFAPSRLYWANYTDALFDQGGLKGLMDSAVVSISATAIGMLVGTLAAYSLARYRTGGGNLSFFILSVLFMPPVAIGIPMFLFWSTLGLVDTYAALVVQYLLFTVPFTTWVMKGFFEDLPPELEESALVNGAGRLRAFFEIALPNVRPALVATTLFAFIFSWNEFTFAVLLSRGRVTTLPFILPTLMESHYVLWGDIAAIASVGALPVIVIAFALRRYLVRGLSFGAIRSR